VAAGRPWWQVTKTARQGFLLDTFIAVFGLAELLAAHIWYLAVVYLVLAGGCLGNAVSLRRRERSGSQADR
jgi:hypothetical protein